MAALTDFVLNLAKALISAVITTTPVSPVVTGTKLGALSKFLTAFPLTDLIELIEGKATVDTVLDLDEKAASLIAAAFPPVAITAEEVGFALEALQYLLDKAGLGLKPIKVIPGYNPIRGGWSGARGHI
jgi:hypothetical protein